MKTYTKIATIKAKLFEEGDEDGFDALYVKQPYISTLENQRHYGNFGEYYIAFGIDGERWLIEKSIFERTYQELKEDTNK
jgi:hypothetical protein